MDLEALRRQLNYEMTQLPQYKHLDVVDIQQWIDKILAEQPERAMFHMKRLFQFGGSEIGALVQSRRNLEAEFVGDISFAHNTDQDIFNYKFLKTIPSPSENNGHLLRGSIFEPQLKKLKEMQLFSQYGHAHQRPDLVQKILQYRTDPAFAKFNWARVQIDDIWEAGDELILLDYKFPTPEGLKTLVYQEPCMYSSQVTLGKMIAHELDIPITRTQVCPIDIVTCSFKDIEVPFNEEFEAEIMKVGMESYELLCNGKRPVFQMPKYQIESVDAIPKRVQQDIVTAATYRNAISELTAKVAEIDSRTQPFLDGIKQTYQQDFKILVGQSSIIGKWKKTFIKEKALEVLESVGADPVELSSAKNSIAKLEKMLKNSQIAKDVINECYKFEYVVDSSLTRSSKGDQAELLSAVKVDISERIAVFDELIEGVLELNDLANDEGKLMLQRTKQLKTLKHIVDNAPSEIAREKAQKILEERSKAYNEPTQRADNDVNPSKQTLQTENGQLEDAELNSLDHQLANLISGHFAGLH